MNDMTKAQTPEDITRLFVERVNAGDAQGLADLYEPDAVIAFPPGQLTQGRDAIVTLYEGMVAQKPHFEYEEPLTTLISGDIALTATEAQDDAGARAQVVRRQADGSWLRVLDRPDFTQVTAQTPPRKLTASRPILPAMSENRVLVVDDEPNIVDVISMALNFQGFTVEAAGTGADALAKVASFRPDLIVLDVMLPDMEGFEVARRLGAERAGTPIIFLTARDAPEDKIRGLTTGGDDYVTKPFSLEELLARVRNVLRRSGRAEADSSRLSFEDLELDEDSREVSRDGNPIDLTATEYRLLRYLMLNPRRVLTRAQLLDHVWDYDFGGDARVLETYISYLRKKLDQFGPSLIHTVRGVGYTLRTPRA